MNLVHSVHDAFEHYGSFTDVTALNTASALPLRKSIRVNTLKLSVREFREYATQCGWELTPVPWCSEGFFVERGEGASALGKDLLHLLGHIYMQEAASMLPVVLLSPKPGEAVLDMAAAPGSKTTQIAARMQGRGVLIANDMQDKRLKTLKETLHRSGVTNAVIVKRMGQWYGEHMVERFDRVLCDTPCTAQGTVRKDPDALRYTSKHSIAKAAALQRGLLEAAVHAAKVGGRIVYSTCTLTLEENEGIVLDILNKFCDQLEGVNFERALTEGEKEGWKVQCAVDDSAVVQESLLVEQKRGAVQKPVPMLRLWPQTFDTEGFFCAVLEKTAPTKDAVREETVRRAVRPLPDAHHRNIVSDLEDRFGTSFVQDGDSILDDDGVLTLITSGAFHFPLPTRDYSLGLPLGKIIRDGSLLLSHELATLLGVDATQNVSHLDSDVLKQVLSGKDGTCESDLLGQVLLISDGRCIGLGKARDGTLKNQLPRWMVQMSSA